RMDAQGLQNQEGRMAVADVSQLLEQIHSLTHDELLRVRQVVERLLQVPPGATPEQELQRRLFAAGTLSEIKPPVTDLTPYEKRQPPIRVKGKPVSETIIEERR